jgi:hypothetical protein
MAPRVLVYLVLVTTVFAAAFPGFSGAGGPPAYPAQPYCPPPGCPPPSQCGPGLPSPFGICSGLLGACTSICGSCLGLPAAIMGRLLAPPRPGGCGPQPSCGPTCAPPPCPPPVCGPTPYNRYAPPICAPRRAVTKCRPVAENVDSGAYARKASYVNRRPQPPAVPVVVAMSPSGNTGHELQNAGPYVQASGLPALRLVKGSLVAPINTDEDGTVYAVASGPVVRPAR